jgi:hypothetical protein
LVSHPALINAPPTVQTKQNKVSILCFNWLNKILATPRQQLSEMAKGIATMMADGDGNFNGQWWWRQQWPMARVMAIAMTDGNATEMAAAMVHGDCNSNCQRRWATAMGDCNGNSNGNGNGVSNGNGDGDGDCNGNGHGQGNH